MSELLGDWLGFLLLLASCVAEDDDVLCALLLLLASCLAEDIGLAFCCFLAAWLRMM